MQITFSQQLIWTSASLSNTCVLAALIKRRAWVVLPALWTIETVWIVLGVAVNLSFGTIHYLDYYTGMDMLNISCYVLEICALSRYTKVRGAEFIPQLEFIAAFLILTRYQRGYWGYEEVDILRKIISHPTAYWFAYCLWSDRIMPKENPYVIRTA